MNVGLDPHQGEDLELEKKQGWTIFRESQLWNDTFLIHADATQTLSVHPTHGERWSHIPGKASLVAQTVTNLPAIQETRIQCMYQEGLLEKGMATHSRILAWRIPWTEEHGRL